MRYLIILLVLILPYSVQAGTADCSPVTISGNLGADWNMCDGDTLSTSYSAAGYDVYTCLKAENDDVGAGDDALTYAPCIVNYGNVASTRLEIGVANTVFTSRGTGFNDRTIFQGVDAARETRTVFRGLYNTVVQTGHTFNDLEIKGMFDGFLFSSDVWTITTSPQRIIVNRSNNNTVYTHFMCETFNGVECKEMLLINAYLDMAAAEDYVINDVYFYASTPAAFQAPADPQTLVFNNAYFAYDGQGGGYFDPAGFGITFNNSYVRLPISSHGIVRSNGASDDSIWNGVAFELGGPICGNCTNGTMTLNDCVVSGLDAHNVVNVFQGGAAIGADIYVYATNSAVHGTDGAYYGEFDETAGGGLDGSGDGTDTPNQLSHIDTWATPKTEDFLRKISSVSLGSATASAITATITGQVTNTQYLNGIDFCEWSETSGIPYEYSTWKPSCTDKARMDLSTKEYEGLYFSKVIPCDGSEYCQSMSGASAGTVVVGGLKAGTTYYMRCGKSYPNCHLAYGTEQSLATAAAPAPTPIPVPAATPYPAQDYGCLNYRCDFVTPIP